VPFHPFFTRLSNHLLKNENLLVILLLQNFSIVPHCSVDELKLLTEHGPLSHFLFALAYACLIALSTSLSIPLPQWTFSVPKPLV
jgi:hypothetical protein